MILKKFIPKVSLFKEDRLAFATTYVESRGNQFFKDRMRIPNVATNPTSPGLGEFWFDTAADSFEGKTAAGIISFGGGTGGSSLDAAYSNGTDITVDNGPMTLNDGQTDTSGGLLITKSGAVTGADSASIFYVNSTGAHDTSGRVTLFHGVMGTETATTPEGIRLTMNANTDNAIKLTKGAVILDDGALTLTSGALTLTSGNLTLTSGDLTLTVGDQTITDGSLSITDADNTTSLTLVNNTATNANSIVDISSTSITTGAIMTINANAATADGEILELISAGDTTSTGTGLSMTMDSVTTGAAKGISVVMAGATTAAKGISVTMDALTTGDMLYLDNGGGTLTTNGYFINCNDDDTSVFTVGENGATVIAGSAEGTDALTLTAGDLTLTDGDFIVTAGEVALTSTANAAGLVLVNNTITTAASLISASSTSLTTGALMTLNANAAAHDGEVLELISAGDATSTPVGLSITMPDITTGAARGLEITMAKVTTTGFGIKVTMDALTTGDMLYLDNGGGTMTGDGKFINCNDDNVSVFAVSSGGATAITGALTVTAGIQSVGADVTATSDGTTTGTIVDGTSIALVQDNDDANKIIILPTPTPGNIVWFTSEDTGYKLRSDTPASVAINGGTGASAESAVGANVVVRCFCNSATKWICTQFSTDGTESKLAAAT